MRSLRILTLLTLFLAISQPVLAAPSKPLAVFTSVKGKVEVRQKGKKARSVSKDSTASAGQRFVAAKGAEATLRFFDGTELKLHSGTDFTLSRLEKADQDKTMKFKLWAGKLLAKVKKLGSPRSSFEIEAGGVVCGVRGTEYSVQYDPDTEKVDINVFEGDVWATSGNGTFQYGPGDQGHFLEGRPERPEPPHSEGGPAGPQGSKDDKTAEAPAGGTSDPFFGVNGYQQDPFTPLADISGGTEGAAGQAGDDNLQGLGAQTVILQFVFPEN